MDTSSHPERSTIGRQYEAAYAVHYKRKDLHEALGLYRALIADHPNSREAGYCEAQIRNIVNAVVPKQDLFEAQVGLAVAHFEHEDQAQRTRAD